MEMNRLDGRKLRAQRQKLNKTEEEVAEALGIKVYAIKAVELCLNISPKRWKMYATNMLTLYAVDVKDLPDADAETPINKNNINVNRIDSILNYYFVGYDVYPQSVYKAVIDFMSFTSSSDMQEAVVFMRKACPTIRIKVYNTNLVTIGFKGENK